MPLTSSRSICDGRNVNRFTKFGCAILPGNIPCLRYCLREESLVKGRERKVYLDFRPRTKLPLLSSLLLVMPPFVKETEATNLPKIDTTVLKNEFWEIDENERVGRLPLLSGSPSLFCLWETRFFLFNFNICFFLMSFLSLSSRKKWSNSRYSSASDLFWIDVMSVALKGYRLVSCLTILRVLPSLFLLGCFGRCTVFLVRHCFFVRCILRRGDAD